MISVIGISHRTAPVALREQFAVAGESLPDVLAGLHSRHGAAVVLSTCNRTELYLSDAGLAPPALRDCFVSALGKGTAAPADALYVHSGRQAARHLLSVASGLDSMVLGEDQVLGQVRGAFLSAADAGTVDRLLSRVFHLAIATGRRVRTQTPLGRYTLSVSAAAVEAVRRRFGDLHKRTVVVISAGEAGKLTAHSLAALGTGRLLITSRTSERAVTLSEAVGGTALSAGELVSALSGADAVISASAALGYQLTNAMVRAARGESPTRDLLVVDIAVPRDVEPSVGDEPCVTLLNIDRLGETANVPEENLSAVAAAQTIVDEEVARLELWWDTLRVVPTISALRERAETIRQAELARSFGRMQDLTPDERRRIEALTAAIVNKMLHDPINKLKQPGTGERYATAVHELFNLPPAAGNGAGS